MVPDSDRELYDLPDIAKRTSKTETDPDHAQLSPHEVLKIVEGDARSKLVHDVFDTEDGSGPAGITHAPGSEGDGLLGSVIFDT